MMDFSLTEAQQAVADLADRIFAGQATVERVKGVEGSDTRIDRTLWHELAKANLLGLCLPEDVGGSGFGIIELCLVLEQQGRRVAPVPLLHTVVAAMAIAEFGSSDQRAGWGPRVVAGAAVLTSALAEPGSNDPFRSSVSARLDDSGGWRLDGVKISVPAATVADAILVPASVGPGDVRVFVVDPTDPAVQIESAVTTNREVHGHVTLAGAPAEALGVSGSEAVRSLVEGTLVGLCALQVGVAEEATRLAAGYTSQRVQFGKPLSVFQGVALKGADAYIDTEAMRATLWQAAWRLSESADPLERAMAVEVAKWWAAEGGNRVVHVAQHLHGGMGADIDYPVHRYFLWGKQIEVILGGAPQQLARLGRQIAEAAHQAAGVGVGA
jgi:3-oxocholest-4-en-26-oyl-CoA dehydrogenase beta subunit